MSFFLSFLLVLSVLTNALPSNLIESSIDENSISIGSNDLTDAGCIRRTSYNFPNEGLEDDLYLVRRQSGTKSNSCPVNIQAPKLQPPRKVETPKWRAPKVLPQVELDVPKGNPRDSEFCQDETRPLLVSCTGPEVWYYSSGGRSYVLIYVLNCIDGKFLNDYNYNTDPWLIAWLFKDTLIKSQHADPILPPKKQTSTVVTVIWLL